MLVPENNSEIKKEIKINMKKVSKSDREKLTDHLIDVIANFVEIKQIDPPPGMNGILYEIIGIEKAAGEIAENIIETFWKQIKKKRRR